VRLSAAVAAATESGEEIEIRIFGGNKSYATPDYLAQIEAALAAAPSNLRVIEVGAYSRENVFELMTTVDWVVVPSIWPETFCLVVSEAWDAKRPVLAARAGGLSDRIVDGQNGFSFLPGSAAQLAALIETCTGNTELWAELAGKITDEVSMNDTWTAHRTLMAGLMHGDGRPSVMAPRLREIS